MARTKLRPADDRECSHAANAAKRFIADSAAAGIATAASAPLNFARNLHFAQPIVDTPMGTSEAIRGLWHEARAHASSAEATRFVVRRLNVGWGTLRVAFGMGLTATLFDGFVRLLGDVG